MKLKERRGKNGQKTISEKIASLNEKYKKNDKNGKRKTSPSFFLLSGNQ